MTTQSVAYSGTQGLRDRVAGEIRAELGRRRISGSALARMLGKEQTWVSRRLNGVVAFDLDDIENIARALDVPVAALLPRLDSNQKPAVLRRPERHLRLVQPAAPVPAQRHPLVTSH